MAKDPLPNKTKINYKRDPLPNIPPTKTGIFPFPVYKTGIVTPHEKVAA